MRTTLGHAAIEGRRGVVDMPPIFGATGIPAIRCHSLQIKAGTQTLSGNRFGDDAAVAVVKDTMSRNVGGLAPESANSLEKTEEVIQVIFLGETYRLFRSYSSSNTPCADLG